MITRGSIRFGVLVAGMFVACITGCGGDDGPTRTASKTEDQQFKSQTPDKGVVGGEPAVQYGNDTTGQVQNSAHPAPQVTADPGLPKGPQ